MATNPNKPDAPLVNSGQEQLKLAQEQLEIQKELDKYNQRSIDSIKDYNATKKQVLELEKLILLTQISLNKFEGLSGIENEKQVALHKEELTYQKILLAGQKQQLTNTSKLAVLTKEIGNLSILADLYIFDKLGEYINSADKAFKNLNKTMGLGAAGTDILRSNLIDSAQYAQNLGVSFEDLTKIQSAYSEATGTGVILNKENYTYLAQIAKGTQMGAEQAGKMAAKFNLMGVSIKGMRDFYQQAVNQSYQFGVSADEVLKKINENFDKSQQYVFKNGVDGLKQMAMYSTKFNLDMNSVFSGLDKNNSLEGVVDTVSKLQVLGGKFAALDPFKLLYEARNDAPAFQKTIQGITNGMATFNKTNGDFEITAGDLQRLRLAADATGVSYESLIATAKKGAQINLVDSMLGGRLDKKSQEFIEGVAQIQRDGSFKVQVAPDTFKNIQDLTQSQVNNLMKSNDTLEQKAKSAQAFDEVFKNTINSLKNDFLPVLKGLDSIITKLDSSGVLKGIIAAGTTIVAVGGILSGIQKASELLSFFKGGIGLKGILGGGGEAASSAVDAFGNTEKVAGATGELGENIKGAGAAAGGAWQSILAFGGAVALIGAGIFVATEGIASMANAFKGLNGKEIAGVAITLGVLGGAFAGIIALAPLLAAAGVELLPFGGAVALIGAGIGIAAAGIGFMAKGFGELFDSLSKVDNPKLIEGLSALVLSVAALGASSLLFANPLAWIGLKVLTSSVGDLSDKIRDANFQSLAIGAASFADIATAIERIDEKKLDKLVALSESLSSINSIASIVGAFTNLFGDGIKVKFDESKVNLEINLTNQIDTQQLTRKFTKTVPIGVDNAKKGNAL